MDTAATTGRPAEYIQLTENADWEVIAARFGGHLVNVEQGQSGECATELRLCGLTLREGDAIAVTAPAAPVGPTQGEVGAWLDEHFGPFRSVEHQALVLAEEVGELCRAVVKRAQGIRASHAEWTAQLHAEAADVLITLLAIAATEGFDLHAAAAAKWAAVTTRNPGERRHGGDR